MILNERVKQVESGYALEGRGIRFFRDLTDSEWEALGREITIRLGGAQWHVGDWLVYGEGLGCYQFTTEVLEKDADVIPKAGRNHVVAYTPRQPLQTSKYERAQILTGFSRSMLSDYYRTSRAFPIDIRVALSWSRHYDTLPLLREDRLPLLRQCLIEKWTSKYWLMMVASKERRNPEAAEIVRLRQVGDPKYLRGIVCPHCHEFIEKARIRKRKIT